MNKLTKWIRASIKHIKTTSTGLAFSPKITPSHRHIVITVIIYGLFLNLVHTNI